MHAKVVGMRIAYFVFLDLSYSFVFQFMITGAVFLVLQKIEEEFDVYQKCLMSSKITHLNSRICSSKSLE